MRAVRVSVPGKLILVGEHAVVYRRPALAAAIDRRLTVELRPRPSGGVALDLPGVAHDEVTTWDAIRRHAELAFAAWQRFSDAGTAGSFAAVAGTDAAHVVKVALGAAIERSAARNGARTDDLPGIDLRVASDLPVGSGFGSSAAAAVAVVAALTAALTENMPDEPSPRTPLDYDELLAVALAVERCQHGRPSGIDTETVLRGGLLWAERRLDPQGERLEFTPIAARSPLLDSILVYDTGRPAESTGEVVAAVRARRDQDPHGFERHLDRLEAAARAFRHEVERPDGRLGRLIELVREAESCLEAMGAVPVAVRDLVRRIEEAGGAAKISGAGAASGSAAGSLLVIAPDGAVPDWPWLDRASRRAVALGASGLQHQFLDHPEDGRERAPTA